PLVVGRNADAGLPADVLDRHAGVGLLEDRDDLGLGETGLLHGTSWLGKTCQKVLLMGCLRIGEAYAAGGDSHRLQRSVGAGAAAGTPGIAGNLRPGRAGAAFRPGAGPAVHDRAGWQGPAGDSGHHPGPGAAAV